MVYLTRHEFFNAAHRLSNPQWTDAQNEAVFGKCANANWHGHNYELIVTVKGSINAETGFLMDVKVLSQIIQQEAANNDCTHIYFGANQSFPQYDMAADEWQDWEMMIRDCLEHGWLSTLDFDVYNVNFVTESSLTEFNNFIPQIRVSIPHVKLWNYNTMVKIDDVDFKATNPGVWSHNLHKLMDRSVFTDWNEYKK